MRYSAKSDGEGAACLGIGCHHPLAIVRMQHVQPKLVLIQPRGVRVTEEILDLRTDVERGRGARVVGLDEVHVDDDSGDVLDQPPELSRGVFRPE
jgi:hypothetical protein